MNFIVTSKAELITLLRLLLRATFMVALFDYELNYELGATHRQYSGNVDLCFRSLVTRYINQLF